MNLHNIALVTGSSRGIGFAIAQALSMHDIRVILTGRSQSSLDIALTKLKSADYFSLDFFDENALDHFLNTLIKRNRVPNIIIHNVGGTITGDKFPLDLSVLRKTLCLNLEVAIKINEKILPMMIEKQFGRIIHVGSDASLTGQASPAYVIAKSALNGYVKTTARFYAKHNIMICAVLPGIIEHEGSAWAEKKICHPDYYKKKLEQMPLGRFGKPEEIGTFVAELVTGNNMLCSGSIFELRGAFS